MFKKAWELIKDTIQGLAILTYAFNFFGGGFFYAIFLLGDINKACAVAFIDMIFSLYLYMRIHDSYEPIEKCASSFEFNLIILATYLLPILIRIAQYGL